MGLRVLGPPEAGFFAFWGLKPLKSEKLPFFFFRLFPKNYQADFIFSAFWYASESDSDVGLGWRVTDFSVTALNSPLPMARGARGEIFDRCGLGLGSWACRGRWVWVLGLPGRLGLGS